MPQTIFISATPADYELAHAGQIVEQLVRPTGILDPVVEIRPATSQIDDLFKEINLRTPKNERILVTTLTKRMAEDLTDFLNEHHIRVRYLHSDIDTVERVEIIRDLRLGLFDVLVGINLLREGLDIPEVSLVAILDADKEGFLRSTRSLIQTIGRAARNINGKAILYADTITNSIQNALHESRRRREKQIEFNIQNHITPKNISKKIKDIIDGVYEDEELNIKQSQKKNKKSALDYLKMDEKTLGKHIQKLEKEMQKNAQALNFEEAIRIRDEIFKLRQTTFGAAVHDY